MTIEIEEEIDTKPIPAELTKAFQNPESSKVISTIQGNVVIDSCVFFEFQEKELYLLEAKSTSLNDKIETKVYEESNWYLKLRTQTAINFYRSYLTGSTTKPVVLPDFWLTKTRKEKENITIEELETVQKLLNSIETLQKNEETRPQALDVIYTQIERYLIKERFKLVDYILNSIVLVRYDILILVGFLTITDPWKKKFGEFQLAGRKKLLQGTTQRVNLECSQEEAEELLFDLG
jgi:hypothetical protein